MNGWLVCTDLDASNVARVRTLSVVAGVLTEADSLTLPDTGFQEPWLVAHGTRAVIANIAYTANTTRLLLYDVNAATGALTEVDSDLLAGLELRFPPDGEPIYSDGQYIYVDQTSAIGVRIFAVESDAFVLKHTVPFDTNSSFIGAGDGLFMQLVDKNLNPSQIEVSAWDGVTFTQGIQAINCWRNCPVHYDANTGRLYLASDSLINDNFSKSGVYIWNAGTQQFDLENERFALAPYNNVDGLAFNSMISFNTLPLPNNGEVCDIVDDIFYAYICSDTSTQVNNRTVKVAYAKLDTISKTYTDLCTISIPFCSVYLSGGIVVSNNHIIANTGYDDNTVDFALRTAGGAGLYALAPDVTTNRLIVQDSYICPLKVALDTYFMAGPVIMSDGVIVIRETFDSGASFDLVGFTYNGTVLTEIFRQTISGALAQDDTIFLFGGQLFITLSASTEVYTYNPGVGFTLDVSSGVILSDPQVAGDYIVTRSAGVSFSVYTFDGVALNLAGSFAGSSSGDGLVAFMEGATLYVGYDLDNASPAVFNGFNTFNFVSFNGTTFSGILQSIGHSPFQGIYYDTTSSLLFEPYPSGLKYGGMMNVVGGSEAEDYVPEGIYEWNGASFVVYSERFALSHPIANSDNEQWQIAMVMSVAKLH